MDQSCYVARGACIHLHYKTVDISEVELTLGTWCGQTCQTRAPREFKLEHPENSNSFTVDVVTLFVG